MKQKIFCILVAFGMFSTTLMAETIHLKVSGCGIPRSEGAGVPFQWVGSLGGSGSVGSVTIQANTHYQPMAFDATGKSPLEIVDGTMCVRFDSTGDTLLLIFDSMRTGTYQITNPTTLEGFWKQHWTGQVVNGTGGHAGAKGTFKMNANAVFYGATSAGTMTTSMLGALSGVLDLNIK